MAGSKFDYLKMLYGDFSKKKEAFINHNGTIEEHVQGLSVAVYEAAKLYRKKYENLRLYKDNKPATIPQSPFELEDTSAPPEQDKMKDVSDKIEDLDSKIKASVQEIQYRYKQLNKVIASFQAVSKNYKDIVNGIFDTWEEIIDKESE